LTGQTRQIRAITALILVLTGVTQLWIVSAGRWTDWPEHTSHYAKLAEAFLHGQVSLLVKPSPQLLALPDPYDPYANIRYKIHDLSLYEGNYYLPWGPVPALLIAAVCAIARISPAGIADSCLAFIFLFGLLIPFAAISISAKSRLFPRLPAGAAIVPIVSLGLGTPVLFILANAAVYEASIAAGQFFLISGLCAAWFGMGSDRPRRWMTLAGICWALAAGSRITLIPATAGLTLLTAWHLRKFPRGRGAIIGLAAPMLCAAILLAWYNEVRFHSPTEFGLRYQLAGRNQLETPLSNLASPRMVVPNLFGYLFAPVYWDRHFPYVWASVRNDSYLTGRDSWLAVHLHLPRNYYAFEPLVGVVWCQPFLIFALWAAKRNKPEPPASRNHPERWLTQSLAAAAILGIAPVLIVSISTMRYLLDALACFTLLAAIGYWRILRRLENRPAARKAFQGIVLMVLLSQCVMGLLLACSRYYDQLMTQIPDLFIHLRNSLPVF
jgi:hypothetical protein